MLLIDSCVWIDWLCGKQEAKDFLQNCQYDIAISVLVMAELMAGARQKRQRGAITKLQDFYTFLDVDLDIAVRGGAYAMQYTPSHGSGIVDCLLAATAETHQLALVTHNKKHFPMLDNVVVPY